MKITAVDPIVVHAGKCNWVFARVQTDENIEGLGEGTLLGKARTVAAGIQDVAGYLVGQCPLNPERIWRLIYESDRYRGGPILTSVLSAIDIACWDILGKRLGVPVWQLLGGACRDKIRLYGRLCGKSESIDARIAANTSLVKRGYTAIKLGVNAVPNEAVSEAEVVRDSIDEFARVRAAVGENVALLFDTHAMLSLPGVISLAGGLQTYSPYCLEEPTPPEDIDGLKYLRQYVSVPLATGERLLTKYAFQNLIDARIVDYIQPDICHAGGFTELKKIAAVAEANHVLVAPHNPSSHSELATMASLHLDASIPNFAVQEHPADEPPWRYDLFNETIEIRDGYAILPTRPGLGLTLRDDIAKAHPYQPYTRVTLYQPDGCPSAT
jgi:galactonate dehydratase